MQISISAIYSEPGYYFEVSHKVSHVIRDAINAYLEKQGENNFDRKYVGYRLGIIDSTDATEGELHIRGPLVSRHYKCVEWVIWMPYIRVARGYLLENFLNCFEEGLVLVFNKYQINTEGLPTLFKEIKEKVLHNPDYEYYNPTPFGPPPVKV